MAIQPHSRAPLWPSGDLSQALPPQATRGYWRRVADDMHDVKLRMTGVEESLAGINRRIGRIETRLDRFEKRL
jgi:hypothetical protein